MVILTFFLTGCGAALNPYNENFRCQAPEDSGQCVDTKSAYDEAIDIGQAPLPNAKTGVADSAAQAARMSRLTELLREPQTPILAPPRVLRVLILPLC